MSHPGPQLTLIAEWPLLLVLLLHSAQWTHLQWRFWSLASCGPSFAFCPSHPIFHNDYCPSFKTIILAPAWLLAVLVVTGWGTINPII